MKYLTLILLLALTCMLDSCAKDKQEYIEARADLGEGDNTCGYLLGISGSLYAPINLPLKYQQSTGVVGYNNIFIKYILLNDSLHCFDNISMTKKSFRYIQITEIL